MTRRRRMTRRLTMLIRRARRRKNDMDVKNTINTNRGGDQ